MRSEISHVHPEIRTQIPDEIIDCNQVSFTAPITDNLQDSVKRPCICLYLPDISGVISVTDYRPEDAII